MEFRAIAHRLGRSMEPSEADEVMKSLDKDGNGVIDVDEFHAWLTTKAPDQEDGDASSGATGGSRYMRAKLTAYYYRQKIANVMGKEVDEAIKSVLINAPPEDSPSVTAKFRASFGGGAAALGEEASKVELSVTETAPEDWQMMRNKNLKSSASVIFSKRSDASKADVTSFVSLLNSLLDMPNELDNQPHLKLKVIECDEGIAVTLDSTRNAIFENAPELPVNPFAVLKRVSLMLQVTNLTKLFQSPGSTEQLFDQLAGEVDIEVDASKESLSAFASLDESRYFNGILPFVGFQRNASFSWDCGSVKDYLKDCARESARKSSEICNNSRLVPPPGCGFYEQTTLDHTTRALAMSMEALKLFIVENRGYGVSDRKLEPLECVLLKATQVIGGIVSAKVCSLDLGTVNLTFKNFQILELVPRTTKEEFQELLRSQIDDRSFAEKLWRRTFLEDETSDYDPWHEAFGEVVPKSSPLGKLQVEIGLHGFKDRYFGANEETLKMNGYW